MEVALRRPLAHDAALLVIATLTKVRAADPKACRRERRDAIRDMHEMRVLPAVRFEAIKGLERSCGTCGRCRGV